MKRSRKIFTSILCSVTGIVLLVTGCVLIHVFSELIHSEVDDQLPLKKGSESYKNWQAPGTPIYFQVWMFDVVNYMEVMEKGERPALVQMGPYTYLEKREKYDIKFSNDGTVSYKESRTFFFDRSRSAGSENDTFHCVNLPMLTVADMVRYENPLIKEAVEFVLKLTGEQLFIKLSVGDLMWGYEDPLLKEVDKVLRPFNRSIPDVFGLFYNQNGTDDGVYEIISGQKGLDHFGEILSWNGNTSLSYWNSKIANAINGSDGTLYPPFISTSQTKYLFSSDLCRSLGMDFKKDVTNRGIDMDRFVAPEIMFGNVTVNPDNAGFCTPPGNCLPSGLLNVSVCRTGAPVVMSMPHFLGCDPQTINAVEGLSPNEEEHSSFLDIEPLTGVVMNAGKKLQINVFMDKIDGFPEFAHLKPIFFPVMWLNESAMISEGDAAKFKNEVLDKIKLTDAVKYSLIAVGGFVLVCVLAVLVKGKLTSSSSSQSSHVQDRDHLVNHERFDDPLLIPNGGSNSNPGIM
ncbi:lysosome membrane protein 2 [Aplysia californica]|uniref:Lysosome membrane protein 2 n=1 Tax=Aplysia californica TaxID=6500 RepID=A0ABM0JL21_APLCA|nr:lysosome membrane protein 2 [Aplysia californica]XP_005096208.1 lysosome membrane protein 2 [Aplysia californica]